MSFLLKTRNLRTFRIVVNLLFILVYPNLSLGLTFAFPKASERALASTPKAKELFELVGKRENIKKYLESDRRIAFSVSFAWFCWFCLFCKVRAYHRISQMSEVIARVVIILFE